MYVYLLYCIRYNDSELIYYRKISFLSVKCEMTKINSLKNMKGFV